MPSACVLLCVATTSSHAHHPHPQVVATIKVTLKLDPRVTLFNRFLTEGLPRKVLSVYLDGAQLAFSPRLLLFAVLDFGSPACLPGWCTAGSCCCSVADLTSCRQPVCAAAGCGINRTAASAAVSQCAAHLLRQPQQQQRSAQAPAPYQLQMTEMRQPPSLPAFTYRWIRCSVQLKSLHHPPTHSLRQTPAVSYSPT